jgi:hypothetical protein
MVKKKTFSFTIFIALVFSLINPITSVAADCPDFKQYEKSSATLVPYTYAEFQKDLPNAIYPDVLRYSGYQIEIGEPVFRLKNMYPMFDPQFLKMISEKGPDAAVYYSEVKSSDGVNWSRLSRAHWDFLEDPEKNLLPSSFNPNAPIQSATSTLSLPQLRPGINLLRSGLTPGMKGAIALEIYLKGCPTRTIYTKRFDVPKFEVKDQTLDTYIANEQRFNQREPMNFLQQEECTKSLNSIVSAAKTASSKSETWSMPQIPSGVLNLSWKIGGQSLCNAGGDVTIQPALGDQCLKRLNPGQSDYSYSTLKFPCNVSIDIRGTTNVQLATFSIKKPVTKLTKQGSLVTITCLKGKRAMTITGSKPVCPGGYKKK